MTLTPVSFLNLSWIFFLSQFQSLSLSQMLFLFPTFLKLRCFKILKSNFWNMKFNSASCMQFIIHYVVQIQTLQKKKEKFSLIILHIKKWNGDYHIYFTKYTTRAFLAWAVFWMHAQNILLLALDVSRIQKLILCPVPLPWTSVMNFA